MAPVCEEYVQVPRFFTLCNSLTLCSVFSSDLITFEVGEEAKIFTLHSALVGKQSPPLDALINGGMREAKEKRVVWREIRTSTFLCFSQFAYTGDYWVDIDQLENELVISFPNKESGWVCTTAREMLCVRYSTYHGFLELVNHTRGKSRETARSSS